MATCRLASSGPSTVGHNWTIFHSTAGPALAVRDGAVMSTSTGPAPGRRGMQTGRLHALYSIGVPSLYRYHGENVFLRGFPLHRAGCVPGTAPSGHSGGTTRLERWRRKSLSSILVCKAIDGHFYTRSGSHCGDTFSVILVYVYRVGRKRGHKLVATIQSNLNRFSIFSLKDSLENLQ